MYDWYCRAIRHPAMASRWRNLALASIIVIALAATASAAKADCTPAAANNVTANCTGTTTNQGAGAPGSTAATNGYGSGTETGVTVNVTGAGTTVSGTNNGIQLSDGTVVNDAGAIIFGNVTAIDMAHSANVTNSGTIHGGSFGATSASGILTLSNNAGASILGGIIGVYTVGGNLVLDNSGSINASSSFAVLSVSGAVSVTNRAGATITGFDAIVGNGAVDVSNSGTITATNGTGIHGQTVTVTNGAGGVITGPVAAIDAAGGGASVVNAGTINGDIHFNGAGNTLTLVPGSTIAGTVYGAGGDLLQLGGSGTGTFDISQVDAAQQYRGFADFNKIGGSTWTLTGTSSFTGPVNVNGGTLAVTGDISTVSALTVNTGGTLSGTGTVGNTTINAGGTLAPGNGTPGSSLLVSGNLAFQSGALYLVQLNPATASFTQVTGVALLGGAAVNAVFANGSYVDKKYTILTATGGVSGSFASTPVTNLSSDFQTTLSYDANNAYLNLFLDFAIPGGLNRNQQAVGNALTTFFDSNGGIPAAFASLSAAGLTQASGELATGTQQASFDAMGLFMGLLTDPFGGRSSVGSPASGAAAYAAENHPPSAYAMFDKAPVAQNYDPRWSVWAAGFGGSQTTDGNAAMGSNTATSRIYGTAVGADYLFSPQTLAGFALAGGGTNFSVNNLGTGRSDLFQAGAYLRHSAGPAYLSAALAYGWQDLTTDRIVTISGTDRLTAGFNTNAWSGRLEGGYRFVSPVIGGVGITPYAAGQFTTLDLPAYAEKVLSGIGTFALAYGARSVTDTRGELGLRSDKSLAVQDGILTFRGRLAWAHDFNPERSIGATFQALPGASFVVNGAARAPDAALATTAAEMKWLNGWSAAATFEGEFSDVTRSYSGKGVLRYAW